jgi:D-3-phosphoglycerate dehydrogenase / 2-oxoglutarate reductase
MGKILVTPRSVTKQGHPALELFRQQKYEVVFCTPGQQPDEAELLRLLPDCEGYLAGVEKVSATVLEAAPRLKAIGRNGVGIDNIDVNAANRLGIKICPAMGANSRGVAELAIALMFSLVRSIPFSDAQLKQDKWSRRNGIEICGKTLGLVGCGHIGRHVATMALGLGMNVLAHDIYKDESFSPGTKFSFTDFNTVLRRSDVISLHCPAPQNGMPLINAEQISLMKKGVYLVNTARAGLLSEPDILAGIESGVIAGVATDVFEKEPPEPKNPMIRHDNVIATPHIGGFTYESIERAVEMAVKELLRVLIRFR